MKVLVTGAAGFIGSHLAEALAHAGHQVIGIDSFTDYYSRSLKQYNADAVRSAGCQLIEADLVTANLQPYLEGVEVVYHAAGQSGKSKAISFATYLRDNVLSTYHLITALSTIHTLKLFVYVSSSSVYGANATGAETLLPIPVSHYGVTKLAAEQLVMAYYRSDAFPACSIRLFPVYGERERPDRLYPRLIQSILQDTHFPLYEGSLENIRSFAYIDDVVKAFVTLVNTRECIGEIINIGAETPIKVGEAIQTIETLLHKKAKFKMQPALPINRTCILANIDKAREMLDFRPDTPLDVGLKREIAWLQYQLTG